MVTIINTSIFLGFFPLIYVLKKENETFYSALKKRVYVFWVYLLSVPFIFARINNDTWFLIAAGRGIRKYGFTTKEFLSMHEGLKAIQQQYPISVSLSWLYDMLGQSGLILFAILIGLFASFVGYKLFKLITKDSTISVILTSFMMTCYGWLGFITTRPYLLSTTFLVLEIYLLESYIQSKNKHYLVGLPIVSFLMINTHASTWGMFFVFSLPFIVDMIHWKFNIPGYDYDSYKKGPVFFSLFISFLMGFINPYGIKAMTYVFKSYGVKEINKYVLEMEPIWKAFKPIPQSAVIFFGLFIVLGIMIYRIKPTKKFRNIYFILGTVFMAVLNSRNLIFWVFCAFYSFAYILSPKNYRPSVEKNEKPQKRLRKTEEIISQTYEEPTKIFKKDDFKRKLEVELQNQEETKKKQGKLKGKTQEKKCQGKTSNTKWMNLVLKGLLSVILGCAVYLNTVSIVNIVNTSVKYTEVFKYIRAQKNAVRLWCSYNTGGHAEFFGVKPYIDPRAEIYLKANNQKEDIFLEYYQLMENPAKNYKKIMNKYKFTHIFLKDEGKFYKYVKRDKNYKKIMEEDGYVLYEAINYK